MSSNPLSNTAVVIGFDRLGGVRRIADLLQRRGCQDVVVLLNAPEMLPELQRLQGVRVVKLDDPFSTECMLKTIRAIQSFGDGSPFICLQDKPMLAYLEAFEELNRGTDAGCYVPTAGIRNARMKPRARALWDEAGLEGPAWTILTGNPTDDEYWKQRTKLMRENRNQNFILKPIQGAGSECVTPAKGWNAVQTAANTIRTRLCPDASKCRDHRLSIDGIEYFPHRDILIEEEMVGPEYTVDGFVQGGQVCGVVQHKESRIQEPFFGDGLIVSPPDPTRKTVEAWKGYVVKEHCGLEEAEFLREVTKGLRALKLDNWVFHAEMIVVNNVPQFVELNPRPPGGLLWQTAGIRLGVDIFEACVDLHLKNSVTASRTSWITGQFPVYADRTGKIRMVNGEDEARAIDGVHAVQSAIPDEGISIVNLDRENYLAFVSIKSKNHKDVRLAACRAREILKAV